MSGKVIYSHYSHISYFNKIPNYFLMWEFLGGLFNKVQRIIDAFSELCLFKNYHAA